MSDEADMAVPGYSASENDQGADTSVDDEQVEIPLYQLLGRVRTESLPPPVHGVAMLPFEQLSPPIFERLAAEAVWRIDGLNRIRIYGRSGQSQGGLDLVGRHGTDVHVYQVRRIDRLTPAILRKAVMDFVSPPPSKRTGLVPPRRFEAKRFVLVTACTSEDTAVEDELNELQKTYAGDIEIDLYDGQELLRMLRDRGSLVYSIFGPEWSREICGHQAPVDPKTPDGRALLGDPVEMLGFGSLRDEAALLDAYEPAAAAIRFHQLSKELIEKGFVAYSWEWRARERDSLRAAGDNSGAFDVAVSHLMDLYEARLHIRSESGEVSALGSLVGSSGAKVALVVEELASWSEYGYDLAPVSDALSELADAGNIHVGRLTTAIAEQVVTDDDPLDDFAILLDVARRVVGNLSSDLRVRLECCIADLEVYAGADPGIAFRDLVKRAHSGRLSESLGALALRRAARAHAYSGDAEEAIELHRRAIIDAASVDHGGDVRDSLRSIAYLSDTGDTRSDPLRSARAIQTARRFLPGSDRAALETLDYLVDGKLPDAKLVAHHWVRHERISGSLLDETIARKRYGEVFERAGILDQAVRQYVLAGARKEAASAAQNSSAQIDVSRYLESRFPAWVHAAAASVCATQADLLPDEAIVSTANALLRIYDSKPIRTMFSPDPVKHTLSALGAIGTRIPMQIASRLLSDMVDLVPRENGRYRFTDEEMLTVLTACAKRSEKDISEPAFRALIDCVRYRVNKAERCLYGLTRMPDGAVEAVTSLASEGYETALYVLAAWGVVNEIVISAAQRYAESILRHEVGVARNSWGIGASTASHGALLIDAVIAGGEAGVDLIDLKDRVVQHLLAWAEDSYDIASSRTDALNALRVIRDCVQGDQRPEIVQRLVGLHDYPMLNEHDIRDQESLHPLSRFRFNTGSELFAAEALMTASYFVFDEAGAELVLSRLESALVTPMPSRAEAMYRGKTLVQVNRIVPLQLSVLSRHPAIGIRQAVSVCWANQDERDPELAAVFAGDSNRIVRANVADCLSKIPDEVLSVELREVLTGLKSDPDHLVRTQANGVPG